MQQQTYLLFTLFICQTHIDVYKQSINSLILYTQILTNIIKLIIQVLCNFTSILALEVIHYHLPLTNI